MKYAFAEQNFFEYHRNEKMRFAYLTFGILALIVLFSLSYYFFLRHEHLVFFDFIGSFVTHVKDAITSASVTGMIYSAVFGGLFFVTIPMELVFISFLRQGAQPYILVTTFIAGFILSFTINYIIGMKLDTISKKIISPQKFYKIKGVLNRYGAAAVFVINLIPFLPAQPLATILGVFKYNKTKFYVYFITGQVVKFVIIAIIYIYIIGRTGGGI